MSEDKSRVDSLPKVGSQLSDEEIKVLRDIVDTLYIIKGLHDEIAREREHLDSVVGRIANTTKQFQVYLEKFAVQGEKMPQLIQQTLREESVNVARIIATKTYEGITEQSNKTLVALENSISRAGKELNDYGNKARLFSRRFLAFMLAAAIVGGLVGGILVHYYAGTGMNKEILNKIENGEVLMKVWPKLSAAEQKRFKALLSQ